MAVKCFTQGGGGQREQLLHPCGSVPPLVGQLRAAHPGRPFSLLVALKPAQGVGDAADPTRVATMQARRTWPHSHLLRKLPASKPLAARPTSPQASALQQLLHKLHNGSEPRL